MTRRRDKDSRRDQAVTFKPKGVGADIVRIDAVQSHKIHSIIMTKSAKDGRFSIAPHLIIQTVHNVTSNGSQITQNHHSMRCAESTVTFQTKKSNGKRGRMISGY